MSKEATNVTALIAAVAERGRKFTDARNTLIAHAVAHGFKQSVIVAEAGVDKGDVSRLAKVVEGMSKAKLTALKSLVISGMSADDVSTLTAAVTFGEANLRRVKPAPSGAAAGAAGKTPEQADESADPLAALYDWLLLSTPEQFEARTALVVDVLARVESDRAAAQEELELEAA